MENKKQTSLTELVATYQTSQWRTTREVFKHKPNLEKENEYFQKLKKTNVNSQISPKEIYSRFLTCFKTNEGVDFKITDYNKQIIKTLCYYFARDTRLLSVDKTFSLKKGIYIVGNIGCGKTSVLKAFRAIGIVNYGIVSCSSIEENYDKEGFNGIEKYTSIKKNYYGTDSGWLFDDLGLEDNGKHYGKESSIMARILFKINEGKRYNMFHVSTNLPPKKLVEIYENRIASRMNEMFNVIKFDINSPDMRRF